MNIEQNFHRKIKSIEQIWNHMMKTWTYRMKPEKMHTNIMCFLAVPIWCVLGTFNMSAELAKWLNEHCNRTGLQSEARLYIILQTSFFTLCFLGNINVSKTKLTVAIFQKFGKYLIIILYLLIHVWVNKCIYWHLIYTNILKKIFIQYINDIHSYIYKSITF